MIHKKLRTIFLGTPQFAIPALREIAQNTDCVCVYTQPDRPSGRGQKLLPTPVKAMALELGLNVRQPEKISIPEEINWIRALNVDVAVVVAYGQILKQDLLDAIALGWINLHASLLPRWRGAAPVQWAVLAGDLESGVGIMKIVQKLDAGPLLAEHRINLDPRETSLTLHDKLSVLGAQGLTEILEKYAAGKITPVAQDETQRGGVLIAKKLHKDMQWLDWRRPAVEIDRAIRGLQPWPGQWIKIPERVRILETSLPVPLRGKPGSLEHSGGVLSLNVSDASLLVTRIQSEGKRAMTATEWLGSVGASEWSLQD